MLPRTIRLDASDTVVFARAAEPGEWAVPGTFLFWGRDPASLSRKEGIAFRSGFLGVGSFGHSTLVAAQPAQPHERAAAVQALARALVIHLGAPDIATALPAAEDEIAQAEALCAGHAPNTLIALHRDWDRDTSNGDAPNGDAPNGDGPGGVGIRERFRTLRPRHETPYAAPHLGGHDRAFHVLEVDDEFDIRNPGGA